MTQQKTLHSLSDLRQLLPELAKNTPPQPSKKPGHDGKGKTVRVFLDTKGRKGKSVTVVAGLQHNPDTMEEIARLLKQHCGAGGTVKDGTIEIQGDQRTRASEKLRQMNYAVK
jgi:translation initiation factor 1